MKTIKMIWMTALAVILLLSCSNDDPQVSSDKTITSFVFSAVDNPHLTGDYYGSFGNDEIQFNFPFDVSVTSLTPTIILPEGVSISPASGVAMDFSQPVSYTVTAQDKSQKTYSVTVVVQDEPLSSEKTITSFRFTTADNTTLTEDIHATISDLQIVCTLPASVSLTTLKPSIEFNGQSVSPGSGIMNDFTSPVTYTVTAQDGTIENYVITILQSSGPIVYVGGSITNFGTSYAALWKDGAATLLTNGTYNTHLTSVFINDNVIHAAGNTSIGNSVASSWKIENGIQLPTPRLNESNLDGYANSIFVSEADDIFIAGAEYKNNVGTIAKVWKNGTMTPLSTQFGVATAVATSGNDAYVTGYEADGAIIYAKLWKNGVETILTPDIERAHAKAIFISGSNVYVAIQSFNGAHSELIVWHNGNSTVIPSDGYADVHSIFVSDNNVYLAGYSLNDNKYKATLWVNSVPTFLSEKPISDARSVYVYEGDVYVAGFEPQGDNTNNAILWKNGVATILSTNAFATSVMVK